MELRTLIPSPVTEHLDLLLVALLLKDGILQLLLSFCFFVFALEVFLLEASNPGLDNSIAPLLLEGELLLDLHEFLLVATLDVVDASVEVAGLLPEELEVLLTDLIHKRGRLPQLVF